MTIPETLIPEEMEVTILEIPIPEGMEVTILETPIPEEMEVMIRVIVVLIGMMKVGRMDLSLLSHLMGVLISM